MNCKSARAALALAVGNDLDDEAARKLQHHLDRCPECRCYQRELKRSIRVLQEIENAAQDAPDHDARRESLWPRLDVRIAARQSAANGRFNGWVPALAVAAACLMILLFSKNEPVPYADQSDGFEALAGAESPLNGSVDELMFQDVPDETFRVPLPVGMRPVAGERWQPVGQGQVSAPGRPVYTFWNTGDPGVIDSSPPPRSRLAGQTWPVRRPQQPW